MSVYLNGWTRHKVLKQLGEKNGFKKCADGTVCVYRNLQGRACLVGAFIPDSRYNTSMDDYHENSAAKKVIPDFKLERFMPFSTEIMQKMQEIHDNIDHKDNLYDKVLTFLNKVERGNIV